ncbi:DUF4054 domain-containing protein [Sphingobium sp. ba1]|jgi:hypothetical protein|uniref:DUF4054 domain-containing protein n=1 Tax=Sphingobium sp. ba1 TaxID=1522072 RepID=UPI000568D973|nr:DUF4054 domain-containing protein [Sphingobium sp. ba1]
MPYTRLSLADFTAKYTAFTTLTEPPYAAWATDAEADITDRYGSYQQRATELMTAHYLALQTIGMDEVSGLIATGATSFKSSTFSATLSDSVIAARAKGDLKSTSYGQQLAQIQRRLFGGPYLIGCPS